MPAIIKVVDGRTVIRVGENTVAARAAASLAEQFAINAQNYANDSALSADAAAIAAAAIGVYTTVGDGEAATTNGQSFYVASGGTVSLYINNAGTGDEVASLTTAAALASTAPGEGAELVGSIQPDTNAAPRTVGGKLTEIKTSGDYTNGLEGALAAVRNTNDATFSGTAFVPNGLHDIGTAIPLEQANVYISGLGRPTIRALSPINIFEADGLSHVSSNIADIRTYGGVNVVHEDSGGEVASNKYKELNFVQFTGNGFHFETGGVTSCEFVSGTVESGLGNYGINSEGGINNDNVIQSYNFLNLNKAAVRMRGSVNGLYIVDARVEGNGKVGETVFEFEDCQNVFIKQGWYESAHRKLLTLIGDCYDGVVIDGITAIGALDGGGFAPFEWDTGTNRVIFGTNRWMLPTIAPPVCLITGSNKNLITRHSLSYTVDDGQNIEASTPERNIETAGDEIFEVIRVTRAVAATSDDNDQVLSGDLRIHFSGHDGGGNPKRGVFAFRISMEAHSISPIAGQVIAETVMGNLSGITCTVEEKAGATTTTAALRAVFAGVNNGLPNTIYSDSRLFNTSTNDADKFVVELF